MTGDDTWVDRETMAMPAWPTRWPVPPRPRPQPARWPGNLAALAGLGALAGALVLLARTTDITLFREGPNSGSVPIHPPILDATTVTGTTWVPRHNPRYDLPAVYPRHKLPPEPTITTTVPSTTTQLAAETTPAATTGPLPLATTTSQTTSTTTYLAPVTLPPATLPPVPTPPATVPVATTEPPTTVPATTIPVATTTPEPTTTVAVDTTTTTGGAG